MLTVQSKDSELKILVDLLQLSPNPSIANIVSAAEVILGYPITI